MVQHDFDEDQSNRRQMRHGNGTPVWLTLVFNCWVRGEGITTIHPSSLSPLPLVPIEPSKIHDMNYEKINNRSPPAG